VSRVLPGLVAGVAGVLVAAGVVFFAVANGSGAPPDFGWTAYAPLSPNGVYDSRPTLVLGDRWTVLWTGGHLLGAALVVLGLVILAGVGGWLLGRRSGVAR
jgi:heme/copper-type cytochrome/quinol oxidase subunit 1